MKFIASLAAMTTMMALSSHAFSVLPTPTTTSTSSTALSLAMDRRAMMVQTASIATTTAVVVLGATPLPAMAGEYVPKIDDIKQIYFLGVSLDRLKDKLGNPDSLEAALDGVRLFNKDPNFYPGYTRNFILKTVKTGADADPRLGYIKQVSDDV